MSTVRAHLDLIEHVEHVKVVLGSADIQMQVGHDLTMDMVKAALKDVPRYTVAKFEEAKAAE